MRFFVPAALLLLPAVGLAQTSAPFHPYLDTSEKHIVMLGATRQNADVELRATRNALPEVGLELDDLGLDDRYNSWMAEYRYRINDRWGIFVGAFTFDVDGRREVTEEFNFEGTVFEAGASLDSELQVDNYIADVMYTAYRSDSAELLLGAGLHAFDLDVALEGRVFVGDLEATRSAADSQLLAPLPNLRAQGFYAITPRLGAAATVGWLSANYDDWDGDFLYLHARLHYRLKAGFGISAGYQFTDIDLTEEKSRGENEYDIRFDGPTVQLSYSF